jgi:hypothetical protein
MPSKIKDYYVYALIDPRSALIRYVGKTVNGKRRTQRHLYPSNNLGNSYRERWLRQLFALGLKPELTVLERTVHDEVMLCEAERWWISYGRLSSWPLTNLTDGGDGLSGYKRSPESVARSALATRGRLVSAETRRRMSEAKKGKPVPASVQAAAQVASTGKPRTPETRARISKANTGKQRSEATRDLLRVAGTGKQASGETKARMRNAQLGKILSTEHKVKIGAAVKQAASLRRANKALAQLKPA